MNIKLVMTIIYTKESLLNPGFRRGAFLKPEACTGYVFIHVLSKENTGKENSLHVILGTYWTGNSS